MRESNATASQLRFSVYFLLSNENGQNPFLTSVCVDPFGNGIPTPPSEKTFFSPSFDSLDQGKLLDICHVRRLLAAVEIAEICKEANFLP